MSKLVDIRGIGPFIAKALAASGVRTVEALACASSDKLVAVRGISTAKADVIQAAAKELLAAGEAAAPTDKDRKKPKKDKKEKGKDKKKRSKAKKDRRKKDRKKK